MTAQTQAGSATIDQLIINSPYDEPREHWSYLRETRLFTRESPRANGPGYAEGKTRLGMALSALSTLGEQCIAFRRGQLYVHGQPRYHNGNLANSPLGQPS